MSSNGSDEHGMTLGWRGNSVSSSLIADVVGSFGLYASDCGRVSQNFA